MTRSLTVSRMRLIALMIVAAFSVSAVAVATGYMAQPASAAKKKKCKKGYKKVKGKCKKVKKKSSRKPQELAPAPALPNANGSGAAVGESAAKKKKKCKKGYKRNKKGKCKKVKKKSSGTKTRALTSVSIVEIERTVNGNLRLKGQLVPKGKWKTDDPSVVNCKASVTVKAGVVEGKWIERVFADPVNYSHAIAASHLIMDRSAGLDASAKITCNTVSAEFTGFMRWL